MEPLTAGAIALVTLLLNKTFEKTGEIIVAKAFEQSSQVMNLLRDKSSSEADAIQAAAEKAALPPGEREYVGEAVLVDMVESVAKEDPKIKDALEALAERVEEAQKKNDKLDKAVNDLKKAVGTQRQSIQKTTKIAETIGKVGAIIQKSHITTITISQ